MTGIIGKKLGMAQIFQAGGNLVAVTYLVCEPNTVWQLKTSEKDGMDAVVLATDKLKKERKTKKFRVLRQFEADADLKQGDEVKADVFKDGDKVTLIAVGKGRGFQGPVRRHNFHVIRKTHGTKYPRHGSTGANSMPRRVMPGLKMAGRMGNNQVTLRNREIILVDADRNLIAVKGPVPGAKNAIVILKKQL